MDYSRFITILAQAGSFIAAFAAIAAGIIMHSVTKKFGTGILARGFKTISIGIFFVALGIVLDAVNAYIQISNHDHFIFFALFLIKEIFFVIGTYTIITGSKITVDKLESLTK